MVQKQLNELWEDFHELQSETKETIKMSYMKWRRKHKIWKRNLIKIFKTSGKKNQTETLEIKSSLNQIKNTGESHSSRLKQIEDRISGHGDKNRY
jgi:epoxyqueuosine reductase QueG